MDKFNSVQISNYKKASESRAVGYPAGAVVSRRTVSKTVRLFELLNPFFWLIVTLYSYYYIFGFLLHII